MRCIQLGSSVGCSRVPQVHFVRKQTMCKSLIRIFKLFFLPLKSRAGFYTTLLTARKLCSATLSNDFILTFEVFESLKKDRVVPFIALVSCFQL